MANTKWDELKKWISDYDKFHKPRINEELGPDGRYCVAISCEDLLNKMSEIETKYPNDITVDIPSPIIPEGDLVSAINQAVNISIKRSGFSGQL